MTIEKTAPRAQTGALRPARRVLRGLLLRAAIALVPLFGGVGGAALWVSDARAEPLLMDGKSTLYQRVLTRPEAVLRDAPEPGGKALLEPVPTFSAYYVFARRGGGDGWVQVGPGIDKPARGWMRARQTIDWKQSMTMAFTNPATRTDADRTRLTLMFETREALMNLMRDELVVPRSQELRQEALAALRETGAVPAENPVVALEPRDYVDPVEEFYLLPILKAEQQMTPSRYPVKVLKVASVPKNPPKPADDGQDPLADFRIGVAFVIDTSRSMGPYIDRTRETIRRVVDEIQGSKVGERVSFGLVGFRDSTQGVPGLGYRTKVYAPLQPSLDAGKLLSQIAAVREAEVSSKGFAEDALAGIDAAMKMEAWSSYDAKFIVLITDASSRFGTDERGAVKTNPSGLNTAAEEDGFAITTVHLKTPQGRPDHRRAEQQYRTLSRFSGDSLYHSVEGGDPASFKTAVDDLTDSLVTMSEAALDGRAAAVDDDKAGLGGAVRRAGLAMQLAYLGKVKGSTAPAVFEAWAADRDFEDPTAQTLEVRVLLTKNQLSDLKSTISQLIRLRQETRLRPDEFFDRMRSAAASMLRDPDRIAETKVESLGDVLGEYLEGLPYESEIAGIDERYWNSMGPARQQQLVDRLQSKLDLYQRFNENPKLWVALAEGAPESEKVYPVPLDALP
jgi:serine/threonine-protein kinase PpkA